MSYYRDYDAAIIILAMDAIELLCLIWIFGLTIISGLVYWNVRCVTKAERKWEREKRWREIWEQHEKYCEESNRRCEEVNRQREERKREAEKVKRQTATHRKENLSS